MCDFSTKKSWLYHPTFPAHWERQSLYSLAEWINGLAFQNSQFDRNGLPVIKIAELKNGISEQTKFTSDSFEDSVHVKYGELLFSWSGQPETSIDAYWWRGSEGWLNQHLFRVIPRDGIDRTFFYYLLRYLKPNFVAIARNKQTTGLGHVTKKDLEDIEAACPTKREQHAIADILGSLDDKIELNRRMNKTLEAMARALFKSWFIDFDPVRTNQQQAEGQPPQADDPRARFAHLFPARFQDSSLGRIPEGWEVKQLADQIGFQSGFAFKSKDWGDEGVPVVKIGSVKPGIIDLREVSYVSENVAKDASRFRLEVADLLIGMTGYVGTVGLVPPTKKFPLLNQRVGRFLIPKDKGSTLPFWYCLMRQYEFRQFVESQAHGTAQPNVSAKRILEYPITMPPDEPMKQYNAICQSCFERILNNHGEMETLATIRDSLLPRLLSGELRLPEAERIAAQAESEPEAAAERMSVKPTDEAIRDCD